MRDIAVEVFRELLQFVDPSVRVPTVLTWDEKTRVCSVEDHRFSVPENSEIHLIGSGKAAPTMAVAAEKIFGSDLTGGLVIGPPDSEADLDKIKLIQGTHPLPDEKSLLATNNLLEYIEEIPEGSLVVNMLSGGTSALLCKPHDEVSLEELKVIYNLLLECGASIDEINTVRKSISEVKGGKLLQKLVGRTVIDIVISDVPDDDLKTIGSGPTTAQEISYRRALTVLSKHRLEEKLPENVLRYLKKQSDREEKQQSVYSTTEIKNHNSFIISSAITVAREAEKIFSSRGFETSLIEPVWTGLIDEFEEHITATMNRKLKESSGDKPVALLFFGECTVNIQGSGKGGRNQELALRMALRLKEFGHNSLFMSAGTDGIDGPTDVAGAVVDHLTCERAGEKDIDPEPYLKNNDSYHFFQKVGGHIKTGLTGNNVMDLQFLLIE